MADELHRASEANASRDEAAVERQMHSACRMANKIVRFQEDSCVATVSDAVEAVPGRQSAVMTRVLLTVALSGGSPLSHTRKGTLIAVPTGKLELILQVFSPTLANSWPVGFTMA